jgi:hypothetical protein
MTEDTKLSGKYELDWNCYFGYARMQPGGEIIRMDEPQLQIRYGMIW